MILHETSDALSRGCSVCNTEYPVSIGYSYENCRRYKKRGML